MGLSDKRGRGDGMSMGAADVDVVGFSAIWWDFPDLLGFSGEEDDIEAVGLRRCEEEERSVGSSGFCMKNA